MNIVKKKQGFQQYHVDILTPQDHEGLVRVLKQAQSYEAASGLTNTVGYAWLTTLLENVRETQK